MRNLTLTMRSTLMGCALAASAMTAPATAQTAAPQDLEKFFAGKNIDFLIGSAPGGGYGIYASVLARHIGKHLPGKPNIVARNLPGAGSLIAANLLYNKLNKDGTVFGALFMGAVMEPLIGDASQTHYDPRKFSFIGSANRETSICVAWATSDIKTFEDMFTKELIIGTSGVTSSIQQYPTVLNNVLKTKFKMVTGYPGSREAAIAMERGETGGICGIQWSSFISNYQQWLDEKKVRIIAQISAPGGDPTLNKMGIPTIWQYVKSDADKKTLSVIFNQLDFGRPYVLPPGAPANVVAAYRAAFDATMKDPEFLAEAEKMKLGVDPVSGADVQKLVEDIYATPKEDVDRARLVLK
ncbi:MAG: tripartite tricarboxylate transporter substrate-binding protein [Beijerinckiaceae bacterium]|nr:tripartite tricarboxylate transporter substrate-binding protein [Beijerinckiaceae bacterium]